jgi:hypothetical protein
MRSKVINSANMVNKLYITDINNHKHCPINVYHTLAIIITKLGCSGKLFIAAYNVN